MDQLKTSSTQFCLTLNRSDNTTVHLVASYMPNPRIANASLSSQFDYYAVVYSDKSDHPSVFTPVIGTKSLNGLSVDEYSQRGRVGLMSVVRPHEVIKANLGLQKKLTASTLH